MRATLFALLFSVGGVCVLAAMDSTLIFFLPLAVDAGVVIITSRHPSLFWFYPILVSGCSLIGAAITFYIGRRLGEVGIERYISKRRLQRVLNRVRRKGAIAMAALDMIPPPFPFTVFILVAGAINVATARFFTAMFAFRVLRFGVEAVLAAKYGRQILLWMESDFFRGVAYFFTALVVVGSLVTAIKFLRSSRRPHTASASRRAA